MYSFHDHATTRNVRNELYTHALLDFRKLQHDDRSWEEPWSLWNPFFLWKFRSSMWRQIVRVILACMCVKPQMHLCVCHRVVPFWVHFGSILGPFWVHLGSIWGLICLFVVWMLMHEWAFRQESVFPQESMTRQESVFRQECSLDKNFRKDCQKTCERSELRCGFSRRIWWHTYKRIWWHTYKRIWWHLQTHLVSGGGNAWHTYQRIWGLTHT